MKIDGTTISFDLYEVIQGATPDQCRDIADALSLHHDVRKRVLDSLLEYETDLHSTPDWGTLDSERKRLLEAHGQMTDDRISKLEFDLKSTTCRLAEKSAIVSRLWDLYHRAPQSQRFFRDELYAVLTAIPPEA